MNIGDRGCVVWFGSSDVDRQRLHDLLTIDLTRSAPQESLSPARQEGHDCAQLLREKSVDMGSDFDDVIFQLVGIIGAAGKMLRQKGAGAVNGGGKAFGQLVGGGCGHDTGDDVVPV